jgi:hypothetical protein
VVICLALTWIVHILDRRAGLLQDKSEGLEVRRHFGKVWVRLLQLVPTALLSRRCDLLIILQPILMRFLNILSQCVLA